VGFNTQQAAPTGIAQYVAAAFAYLGIPLTLLSVLGVYVVITALYALFTRSQTRFSYMIQGEFGAQMREKLYAAIVNTNWLFFSRNRASTFTHALTGEVERVSYGTQQILQGLAGTIVLIIYFFVAWELSAATTAAVALCGVILIIVLKGKISLSREKGRAFSQDTRDL
jgi:ATP-binding cassette subfamily C protein